MAAGGCFDLHFRYSSKLILPIGCAMVSTCKTVKKTRNPCQNN
jgi:hypothetical protein